MLQELGGIARPRLGHGNERCQGLLRVARGDTPGAVQHLQRALLHHQRIDMPFEQARTLLCLGRVQRRGKQRKEARTTLTRALEMFEQVGAPLWADRARAELDRTHLREAPTSLTPSELRVAADDANVVVGLPEVSMGLIPSGGGTQRFPRLIGPTRALDLILRGRRLTPDQARRVGLLEAVVPSCNLDEIAVSWARKPKRARPSPRRMGLIGLAEQTAIGRRVIFDRARRALPDHYPAMRRALDAIELGYSRGLEAGLAAETRAVRELTATHSTRSLTWLSVAEQHQRVRFRANGVVRTAVIGRSAIGAAINEVLLKHRVQPADADLIVVAVADDVEHQRAAVREIESLVRPDATIAVHTSSTPLKEMALAASRPERIVGTRFIAPVQQTRLLEVVQHERVAESALAVAAGLGTLLDKTVIVVADRPGFFISRVLGLMLNEAALMVDEGARVADIDRAMRQFGFAVGPLRLLDEVGLEVIQRIAEPLEKAFGERMPTAPRRRRAHRHGRRWPHLTLRLLPVARQVSVGSCLAQAEARSKPGGVPGPAASRDVRSEDSR